MMIFFKIYGTVRNVFLAMLLFSASLLSSCIRHSSQAGINSAHYFSLNKYFKNEAAILSRLNPGLVKTISVSGKLQTKRPGSINWIDEFSLFTASDINKPAWIGKYRVDSNASQVTYMALDSDLKVRRIEINKNRFSALHPVSSVKIKIGVQNFLYTLNEELDYYTDSLYIISRRQHINLLGSKYYKITGKIKHQ